jgi:energy-converting hydrogenase Eha subunit C
MNFLCLLIWIVVFVSTFGKILEEKPISAMWSISAMLICIIHFAEKCWGWG